METLDTLRELIKARAMARFELAGVRNFIEQAVTAGKEILREAGISDDDRISAELPTERNEFADLGRIKEAAEEKIAKLTVVIREETGRLARLRARLPELPAPPLAATETPVLATAGASYEGDAHD